MKCNFKNICIFFLLIITVLSCNESSKQVLPIYNPSDFNPKLVDKGLQTKSAYHTVSDFNLINQNGETITQEDYQDKIYVTDFFFTTCKTICPTMTNNMAKIQEEFLNSKDVMLLSISVLPDTDSASVLREYADKKGVIDSKWNITTGKKKHIYQLARQSYFAVVEQGDGEQDFIHTPKFVLIDKEKQIRGIYDGTNDEDINRIITDIKVLQNN